MSLDIFKCEKCNGEGCEFCLGTGEQQVTVSKREYYRLLKLKDSQPSEWVKCAERMPEERNMIFFRTRSCANRVFFGKYENNVWKRDNGEVRKDVFEWAEVKLERD